MSAPASTPGEKWVDWQVHGLVRVLPEPAPAVRFSLTISAPNEPVARWTARLLVARHPFLIQEIERV